MYVCEYTSAIKNEWNVAICNSTDGPWGHCARWNKLARERQISYDLLYVEYKILFQKAHGDRELTDGWQRLRLEGEQNGEVGEKVQTFSYNIDVEV